VFLFVCGAATDAVHGKVCIYCTLYVCKHNAEGVFKCCVVLVADYQGDLRPAATALLTSSSTLCQYYVRHAACLIWHGMPGYSVA
jgi:hypothetical protein